MRPPEQAPPVREVVFRSGPNRLAVVLLGVFLLAGGVVGVLVARSRDDARSAAIPAGWTVYPVEDDGFSLALPPGWYDVPPAATEEALAELGRRDAALAGFVRDQLGGSLSPFVRFLAADTRSPTLEDRFLTNMNVVIEPLPDGVAFDGFVRANLARMRALAGVASSLADTDVSLPAGRAAVVRSRFSIPSPDGARIAAVTQFLLTSRGFGYILSFTTTPAREAADAVVFREIMRTFRFV